MNIHEGKGLFDPCLLHVSLLFICYTILLKMPNIETITFFKHTAKWTLTPENLSLGVCEQQRCRPACPSQ